MVTEYTNTTGDRSRLNQRRPIIDPSYHRIVLYYCRIEMTATKTEDPIALFKGWLAEAEKGEPNEPTAVALATADTGGRPSVRMVLLKAVDDRGFVFYTNTESRKAVELAGNPWAALCFHWKSLRRQVRVEGSVAPISPEEADAYFATRPKAAQIGAWASKQSRRMEGRFELEKRVAQYTAKFVLGPVPRPDFWSGYRVAAESIEFWLSHQFRLHDRYIYRRGPSGWTMEHLYP